MKPHEKCRIHHLQRKFGNKSRQAELISIFDDKMINGERQDPYQLNDGQAKGLYYAHELWKLANSI